MYNNLNILSYPVNRTQLLIHLTLWTFSVGSLSGQGFITGDRNESLKSLRLKVGVFFHRIEAGAVAVVTEVTMPDDQGTGVTLVEIFEQLPHRRLLRCRTRVVGCKRDKQIDMRCCLNVVSSSNDYENRTFGLRARTFSHLSFVSFHFGDERKEENSF